MRDEEFEWDDRIASVNRRKHGVAFDDARSVFADSNGFERLDLDQTEEERYLLTGFAGNVLLTLVFVYRSSRIRIISARKASPNERPEYVGQIF